MSDEKIEYTASGTRVFRHEIPDRDLIPPQQTLKHRELIQAHIGQYIGEVGTVMQEVQSDQIQLDILLVPATEERPFNVLVTSGVSDLPMLAPQGMERFSRIELMMVLPPDWPISAEAFDDDRNFWPIHWLKQVGRLPHMFETWLGWGHSIPNGDPPEKIAGTDFAGVILSPSYWLPEEFLEAKSPSGESIFFFELVPLYREEMDLKLEQGMEALYQRFAQADIGFILDTKRPNVG